MRENDEEPTQPFPADDLDAGLRAAFEGVRQSGNEAGNGGTDSVINLLGMSLGVSACLSLRDPGDDPSPVVRARSAGDSSAPLPERIGRYRITGEIASGGVGSVFRAHDVDLGRDVAFKVLRECHTGNRDMTRRFLEEAQIGGQLQHPGIVSVHEMGLLEGARPYFTMKLVKGRTLATILDDRQSPAEERQRFLGVFEQVCQPIAFAHARGVIHRDLKTSNVMVGAFGEVQVMDWGLAKVLARGVSNDDRLKTKEPQETIIRTLRSGDGSSSLAGLVLGTPAYMAPEQARGDVDDLDERSDVFGLGAILCEILTGDPPYSGVSLEEVHRRARDGDLADAHARIAASGAEGQIIDLARRCLAPDPGARPRNAGAVAREVRDYLDSLEARAREERVRAARARLRTVVVAAAMVAMATVGLSGLWLEMERRDALSVTASRVRELMGKAEAHLASARPEAEAMLGEAESAREAFQTAATLLDRKAIPDLAADLERLGESVERSIRRATFLARLEQFRRRERFPAWIRRAYDEAFSDLIGGRIFDLPPQSLAERIRADGLQGAAALALDDWALARREYGEEWHSLAEISIAVEPNVARRRLWGIVERGSPEGLAELVTQAGVTAAQLVAAGSWAEVERHADVAEGLYRGALEMEPGNFRAHTMLGNLLTLDKQRRAQGLPHLLVALAMEPGSSWANLQLASAYADAGAGEDALRLFRSMLPKFKHDQYVASICPEILGRPDLSFSKAGLDAFIEEVLGIARTGERLVPGWWRATGAALVKRYCPGEAENALGIARDEVERTHRREPDTLMMLSAVEYAAGRPDNALRTLQEADALPGEPPYGWRRRMRACQRALGRRIVSYASIDAAIDDPVYLVEEGDTWQYFKGTRLPSPGVEWTEPDFDDSGWLEGPTRIGYGSLDDATVIEDMRGNYWEIYARRSLEIPNPARYSRIVLSVDADDGFTAWVNGEPVLEAGIDPESGRVTHQYSESAPVEIEITGKLWAGRNVIAIRVRNVDLDSSDLWLIPEVWGTRAPDRGRAGEWSDPVRAGVKWDASGALETYFEARLALERGENRLAAERFRRVIELDRGALEPYEQLREAVARSEGKDEAEKVFRAAVAKGGPVAFLRTPPAEPEGLRVEEDGSDLVLAASGFRHADPRVEHAWTRWQVRAASGDYDRTPVVDILSDTRRTRFVLPRHALEPGKQYFWRVTHYAETDVPAASVEQTFTTGDYSFETVPFELTGHFNRDVVANPGDLLNDYADSLTGRYITDGFDGKEGRPEAIGLPADRAVGFHRLADYDGPNALQLGARSLLPIRIRAPEGSFSALRILVAGSHGDTIVPVSLEYADGVIEHATLRVEDWYDDPQPEPVAVPGNWLPVLEGPTPIRNGMNREWEGSFDSTKDVALFETTLPLAPGRVLRAIVIEPAGMVAHNQPLALVNIFSILGVRAGER